MRAHTTSYVATRTATTSLVVIALLAILQPFSLAASAETGPAPHTTRLRPQRAQAEAQSVQTAGPVGASLDPARADAMRRLVDDMVAGGAFSLEEIEILNDFAFGEAVSELEADVVISRALYAHYIAKVELTREQELVLEAYQLATARRERAILDAKQAILEAEEAEMAKAPRAARGVPNNDTCEGAIAISPTLPACSAVVDDITDATTTGDPGLPSCQTNVSRSVWFTFTPASTGYYRLSTCSDQGSATTVDDTVLAVYTSTGGCNGPFTEIPFSALSDPCDDDSCATEGLQSVLNTQLTGGTTYYVVVWKFGTSAPTTGNTAVQVCVSAATAPMAPSNDTCAGAIPLTANVPTTGSNGPGTDNDYQLAAMSPCFPAGQTASTAAGRDVVYSFTAPAAGNYSFRVTNYVPNATAGVLSNLVVYLADSCPAATPGTPVTVACTAASNASTSSSGTLAEEITCVPMTMGQTVFLFVDEAVGGAGATFNVLAELCGALESEANDTPGTADALACGITGSVNPATDADFYSLGTPAAGSRVFAATDASTATPSSDIDLRVNTTTDTVEYDDANNDTLLGGGAANLAGTIATGTALFLQVDRFGATPTTTSSPYRLYAVVQPAIASATVESESNDAIETADSAENNYFSGALAGPSPSTDADFYGFQAVAGDLVFVSLDGDPLRDNTPVNARIDVLDAAGNILFTANDGGSSSSTTTGAGSLTATTPNSPGEAIVFRAPATGNFYVRVTAGSTSATTAAGDYLLSISRNCQIGGGGLGETTGDSVGVYAPSTGAWFLRNSNSAGPADLTFFFGNAGGNFVELAGDWDGDGDDTIGLYDPTTGTFFLRNTNSNGPADITFQFGVGGANIVPIVGDWDGDGDDTIGLYDFNTGAFFLKNTNAGGEADITFFFGVGGAGILPVTGDFDGDGDDTVGLYNMTNGAFFLRNTNSSGPADVTFFFGTGGAGILPVFGDYDGDGDDTVGLFNTANAAWFLRNTNTAGTADLAFFYGAAGTRPVVGNWDGN